MLEGEYIINGTRFTKPSRYYEGALIRENVAFITSANLKQNLEALIKEKDINTIRLTDDYKLENLDFLTSHNLDFIESIDILSDSVKDFEGLYSLRNLIRVNSQNSKIDYTKFKKLKSIGLEIVDKYSLEKISLLTKLERLGLYNKYAEIDLSILSKNINLKQLQIRSSKLKSLKGLENFKDLELLGLFHNRSLTSLEGISKNHTKLRKIEIYSAPKLLEVNNYLGNLQNLTFLQLDSKRVDSFGFLNSLNKLELLSIHNLVCDVEDGNKVPLIDALKRTNGKIW
ncbi:hypothetical protein [Flavobacterium sp. DSP2-3-1]|uniref:hypothetical protein n=1 Tax=Flavobacterium sp. DSP2-3-1 TaxID=2804620 RepID=UPI003CF9E257